MEIKCLASSSKGNCYALTFKNITNGMSQSILIDCGISYNELLDKCNQSKIKLSDFGILLLSHGHADHSKCVSDLIKRGVDIFTSQQTIDFLELKQASALEPNTTYDIITDNYCFKVMPFKVEHDFIGTYGYIVSNGEEKILFITDAKKVSDIDLSKYLFDQILIECNYDSDQVYAVLHENKKIIDNYEEHSVDEVKIATQNCRQIERNLNSHMSLRGTIKTLEQLNLVKTKAIFLIHLSNRYANEQKMKAEIEKRFGVKTFICKQYGGIF